MPKLRELTAREHKILDRLGGVLQEQNVSWSDAARRAGKSGNLGNQWSSRRSFPKEEALHRLCGELGITMGWLLTGAEPNADVMAMTQAEKEALAAFRALSPQGQQIAIAQIEALRAALTTPDKK
jgi:transcriptional regulator with XRE-family HTH domain